MSNLIYQVHNKTYISQKGVGLYPTTGTASDWYKDRLQFSYANTSP